MSRATHRPHTDIYIASSPPLGHDSFLTIIPIYTHIIPTAPSGLDKRGEMDTDIEERSERKGDA
jgi:hypothetical protein